MNVFHLGLFFMIIGVLHNEVGFSDPFWLVTAIRLGFQYLFIGYVGAWVKDQGLPWIQGLTLDPVDIFNSPIESEVLDDVYVLCNKLLVPTSHRGLSSLYNGARIEGELSQEVYDLCHKLLGPAKQDSSWFDTDDGATTPQDSGRTIDDLQSENKFLKDWLSLVAADSKLAIDVPLVVDSLKQHNLSDFLFWSPVGSWHCEELLEEQVAALDFSLVKDETVRGTLTRTVLNELKKQHHNCLIQSSYIELQNQVYRKEMEELQKHTNSTIRNQQSTNASSCLCKELEAATEECDQRLLSQAGENSNALRDKETDCESRIALKERDCQERIALKEMGCNFAISLKEEACHASERFPIEQVEQGPLGSYSWSSYWGRSLESLRHSLNVHWPKTKGTSRSWIESNSDSLEAA